MQRRHWLIAAAQPLLAGVLSRPLPAAAEAVDLEWIDAQRQRRLPLRMRWPDGDGRCPLVLFSHGLGGSREGGDAWGAAWRDAGFAVLHLQHPGSDAALMENGLKGLLAGATPAQLLQRVADVRFVLDELQRLAGAPPWSRLLPGAVGLAGHSFGAITAQALAGERFPLDVALADPRIAAFVWLSPSAPRGRLSVAQAFGTVARPVLCVTGGADGNPFGSYDDGAPRARVFDGLPAGQGHRALLWLQQADHMSFAGQAQRPIRLAGVKGLRDAEIVAAEPHQHRVVARVSTLWWQRWLADDRAAGAALQDVPQWLGPGDRWVFD